MLQPLEVKMLVLFNSKADELINSSLAKETKTIKPYITFEWKQNEETKELDFQYDNKNHTDDALKSFILTLRLFIQDNERISVRNINSLYDNMNIDLKYKYAFRKIRTELNNFLDSRPFTSVNDNPTFRQMMYALIYGKYAHLKTDKIEKITGWSRDKLDWDVIFFQFQSGLYEFLNCIRGMKFLNEIVLKEYT